MLQDELDGWSLVKHRGSRSHQPPKCFEDILPQPLPLLPPTPESSLVQQPTILQSLPNSLRDSLSSRVLQIFRTPQNRFGLFRQYLSEQLPSHDPEEYVDFQDLSEGSACETSQTSAPFTHSRSPEVKDNFYPYPNESSFHLRDWYWNCGNQKSHKSLHELVRVVGDPEFRPDNVQHTQWAKINTKLARNDFDEESGQELEEGEWMDEDSGWMKTLVSISVPFAKRSSKAPGPRAFMVGDLYHRSFVSVIREKLANPHDDQGFHYKPFELFWRCLGRNNNNMRVHGELYTSPAFLDAHRELQESAREPGCSLPRS